MLALMTAKVTKPFPISCWLCFVGPKLVVSMWSPKPHIGAVDGLDCCSHFAHAWALKLKGVMLPLLALLLCWGIPKFVEVMLSLCPYVGPKMVRGFSPYLVSSSFEEIVSVTLNIGWSNHPILGGSMVHIVWLQQWGLNKARMCT